MLDGNMSQMDKGEGREGGTVAVTEREEQLADAVFDARHVDAGHEPYTSPQ